MSKTYSIQKPVRAELRMPEGLISLDLDAGEHTPTDPAQVQAFDHLVKLGAAAVVTAEKAPAKKRPGAKED